MSIRHLISSWKIFLRTGILQHTTIKVTDGLRKANSRPYFVHTFYPGIGDFILMTCDCKYENEYKNPLKYLSGSRTLNIFLSNKRVQICILNIKSTNKLESLVEFTDTNVRIYVDSSVVMLVTSHFAFIGIFARNK